MFFVDCGQQSMEWIDVLSGSVQVSNGDNLTQFKVLVLELPCISPRPPLEVYSTVEIDANQFLDSPLLRRSLAEDVVATNVVSRMCSPALVYKKDKKGRKKFKYKLFFL
jgi:hypothetical protein